MRVPLNVTFLSTQPFYPRVYQSSTFDLFCPPPQAKFFSYSHFRSSLRQARRKQSNSVDWGWRNFGAKKFFKFQK